MDWDRQMMRKNFKIKREVGEMGKKGRNIGAPHLGLRFLRRIRLDCGDLETVEKMG